jgi:hypothetical protein
MTCWPDSYLCEPPLPQEAHMNSRFYKQLSLKSDRQTVAAGGPCEWEDGDASAVVKDVTATQGDVLRRALGRRRSRGATRAGHST